MRSRFLLCVLGSMAIWALTGVGAVRGGDLAGLCTAPGVHASRVIVEAKVSDAKKPAAVLPTIEMRQYPRCAPARPAGSGVSLAEIVSATVVVTSATNDTYYGQGQGAFWGVRVNHPGHGFVEGEIVEVAGVVGSGSDGELVIEASSGIALGMEAIKPIAVGLRSVAGGSAVTLPFGRYSHPPVQGGAGLGAPGTFLTTGGIVTAVSEANNTMTISDGSKWGNALLTDPEGNDGVRVFAEGGPYPPVGTFVQVTGVGSNYQSNALTYAGIKGVKPSSVQWQFLRTIRVHFVRVSNDDGSNQTPITPQQAAVWVARANQVYQGAGIAFIYNPATDFTDFNSTMLNYMAGSADANWTQSSGLANAIAALTYPGKMVVFVRQAAGGFSWWDLNFVAMPKYETYHCGSLNTSLFSHEVGHYLGLYHTFPTDPFANREAAEQYFINNGSNPAIFDGDKLWDTLPDPGIKTMECGSTPSVILDGVTFQLPRDNIMSYYKDASELSTLQKERVQWTLNWRASNKMPSPKNAPTGEGIFEAEDLWAVSQVNCPYGVQTMTEYGEQSWSNGKQIFAGCGNFGDISFLFTTALARPYQIAVYLTHAPDFAKVLILVDGVVRDSFDGYGAFVAPSGRLNLGNIYLGSGVHSIKLSVVDKNEKSSGYYMGIDCFQIK